MSRVAIVSSSDDDNDESRHHDDDLSKDERNVSLRLVETLNPSGAINAVLYERESEVIVAALDTGALEIFRNFEGKFTRTATVKIGSAPTTLAWDVGRQVLYVGASDCSVRIMDIMDWRGLQQRSRVVAGSNPASEILFLHFENAFDSLIAVAERSLMVFDRRRKMKRVNRIKGLAASISSAAYDARNFRLFVGLMNGSICFFDLALSRLATLDGAHEGSVRALAFDSRLMRLYSGGFDGLLKLWLAPPSANPLTPALQVRHHDDVIGAAIVCADRSMLITGAADRALSVWRSAQTVPADGETLLSLACSTRPAHRTAITALHWVESESSLISAAETIKVFQLIVPKQASSSNYASLSDVVAPVSRNETDDDDGNDSLASLDDSLHPPPDFFVLTWLDLLRFAKQGVVREASTIVKKFCSAAANRAIDVNRPNAKGNTALHYAAAGTEPRLVKTLVRVGGARIDSRNTDEQLPLHYCTARAVAPLLMPDAAVERARFVNSVDRFGCSPLHYVARVSRDTSLIGALVDCGASVNARDRVGAAPLNFAVLGGNKRCAIKLLELRAEPSFPAGSRQLTPLHIVASRIATSYADAKDADAVFAALLGAGANANARDVDGNSPLHIAAARDHAGFVNGLLCAGASPRLKNAAGRTAIDVAKTRHIVDLLTATAEAEDARIEHRQRAHRALQESQVDELREQLDRAHLAIRTRDQELASLRSQLRHLLGDGDQLEQMSEAELDDLEQLHRRALDSLFAYRQQRQAASVDGQERDLESSDNEQELESDNEQEQDLEQDLDDESSKLVELE
jgi:ankyrin repeat protein